MLAQWKECCFRCLFWSGPKWKPVRWEREPEISRFSEPHLCGSRPGLHKYVIFIPHKYDSATPPP